MTKLRNNYDVVIIGAGPAGSLSASLLTQKGFNVLVIEKQHFPRFSIGESLLPQSMVYLEEAGLLDKVYDSAEALGFQYKNGASFFANNHYTDFNFSEKFTPGPESTYQVKRAQFDQLLADESERQGAHFSFGYTVTNINIASDDTSPAQVEIESEYGESSIINCQFILDASGFARVLPRLLELDVPSDFPVRSSVFCHIEDNIVDEEYDRNKILIESHPHNEDVWYWLIPFSDGTASLGCVAKPDYFDALCNEDSSTGILLDEAIAQTDKLNSLLVNSKKVSPVNHITGYSADVKSLYGKQFALLGNAGEFLDPIFSSGVTIAFKSAKLASDLLKKQLSGKQVSWENEFSEPLKQGISTFKAFVESWYQGQLQSIIHYEKAPDNIRQMVCSVLAGYAWDLDNPFVKETSRRLNVLGSLCES